MSPKPRLPGLSDHDQWRQWWESLHQEAHLSGQLGQLAVTLCDDPKVPDGRGAADLEIWEGDLLISVEVQYRVERLGEAGNIFHVLSIRSPGDELPPWVEV